MRFKGKIKLWKDDKGYGFISPFDEGADVFLHVSAFQNKGRKPKQGDIVTYETVIDNRNRLQAQKILFAGEKIASGKNNKSRLPSIVIIGFLAAVLIYIGYLRISHPNSTIDSSIYKATQAREAINAQERFTCEGKKYCSEMTSCAEAFFYQENCPATEMDGDYDGVPCEQQWCQ